MKRYLVLALFVCVSACGLNAQVTDTTVCAVLKAPQSFDGKIVRIKGTVVVGFDEFTIHDADCAQDVNSIWISYPPGAKGKAGPAAMMVMEPAKNFSGPAAPTRTPVTLEKSKDFKQFDNLLSQQHEKGTGLCLGCAQNQVTATLVGRLDGTATYELKRDPSGKLIGLGGFGNGNEYPARLVLQSVSDVAAKPNDYSKIDAIAKAEPSNNSDARGGRGAQPSQEVDPIAAITKIATALASNPLGAQITKAIEVFPKPKTPPTNVSFSYGETNEVRANDGMPGAQDSPDGALYICTFNKDKIKEDALPMAFLNIGQHVNERQTPLQQGVDSPPYVLEYNAWVVMSEAGISTGLKYITLPGGYIMWDYKWSKDDQVTNMGTGIQDFLGKEEMLSK